MRTIDEFWGIEKDLSRIGLLFSADMTGYFCTPLNSIIIAFTGGDGVHFCFLPEENDDTLEHSPVYAVSPMAFDNRVEIVAEDFYTFISLVVNANFAGALAAISYDAKHSFLAYVHSEYSTEPEVTEAVAALSNAFQDKLKKIDDVYDYVKQLQAKTDLSHIEYSDEFYDLCGEERPSR